MIIGHGMVAKAFFRFRDDDKVLIFASGVSNSSETDTGKFEREQCLLTEALARHKDTLLVYFSTCSIEDKSALSTRYVRHKIGMEKLISENHERYLICRLPQAVGRSANRTTLVNYLCDKIVTNTEFTVWENAFRYLIDIDDAASIVSHIIDKGVYCNRTLNICALRYSLEDIVRTLEEVTGKKARYTTVEKGTPYLLDNSDIAVTIQELNLQFDDTYLQKLLKKYCGKESDTR